MSKTEYIRKEKIGYILKNGLDLSNLDKEFTDVMEAIDFFYKTLNFDNDFLDINLLDLDVSIYYNYKDLGFNGAYNFISNEIIVDSTCIHKAIYHELFHMASSKRNDEFSKTGFLVCDNGDYFNFGLNEGYTDLLAERYFGEEVYYKVERDIAYLLEMIVTRKKMEELYYLADFDSLAFELERFSLDDDILAFIMNVDFISAYISEKPEEVDYAFYDACAYLIKVYYAKELDLFRKKVIDEKRFIYDLSLYINLIRNYKLLDNLEIRTILYEVLNNDRENSLFLYNVKYNNVAKNKIKTM